MWGATRRNSETLPSFIIFIHFNLYYAEEQQLFVDPDNILNDTQVKEETIEDRVRRQFAEIRKLEKIHDTLQEELYELDHLMKQYAAQM